MQHSVRTGLHRSPGVGTTAPWHPWQAEVSLPTHSWALPISPSAPGASIRAPSPGPVLPLLCPYFLLTLYKSHGCLPHPTHMPVQCWSPRLTPGHLPQRPSVPPAFRPAHALLYPRAFKGSAQSSMTLNIGSTQEWLQSLCNELMFDEDLPFRKGSTYKETDTGQFENHHSK